MPVSEDFLAFLDTETGGVTPGKDPVIEIATILTDHQFHEIDRIEMKVQLRPGDVVQPEAARVNGYTPEAWAKEARPFGEWKAWLSRRVPYGSVAIPVGHNVGFDRDMIDLGYYKPQFCPLSYRKIDTLTLAMCLRLSGSIHVADVKLGTVAKALGIEHANAHGAMSDALAAKGIFELALQSFLATRVMTK